MEIKKSAIDLTDLAIGIIILGIVVNININMIYTDYGASKKIEKKKKELKEISNKPTFKSSGKNIKQVKFIQPGTQLTRQQNYLNELFGNSDNQILVSGTGRNLPRMNGVLITGKGLTNIDEERETGGMFGI